MAMRSAGLAIVCWSNAARVTMPETRGWAVSPELDDLDRMFRWVRNEVLNIRGLPILILSAAIVILSAIVVWGS